MMYGLPPSTSIRKAIPKDAFFSSKNIMGKEKERFDTQVHRLTVLGLINPDTVNLKAASDIKTIYIMEVQLNEPDYDERILVSLDRLGHKTVYVMSYQERCRLAVVEGTVFQTKWIKEGEVKLEMVGLNIGEVWANFVRSIGNLTGEEDFEETIERTVRNEQIQKQIDLLEKKLSKEKQNHVQRELFAQIQELKKKLE
ncbi:MAG: DUF4391 domain-containing protein [archaeon]|nr:DUF4391 domain-containing protein [archaeon]